MKIAIIGLGRAGWVHREALRDAQGVELVAVSDPSDHARAKARAEGIPAFADPNELFDSVELDAVAIATPPTAHSPLTHEALERGLHVLCEKPLATGMADALAMIQAAHRVERHLLLATKFRHVPDLVIARELISTGLIGDPVTFEVCFCSRVDMSGRWNVQKDVAGGGVIIDNGCHAIDIVSYLFGSVSRIHASRLKQIQKLDVEDSATIQVRAANGVIGRIELTWSYFTGSDAYVVVHGSEGSIEIGWNASRFRIGNHPWKELPGGRYDKIDSHRRMHECFAGAIARPAKAEPWISSVEALRTVAAVDAAYRSLETDAWETVDTRALPEQAREEKKRA